MEQALAEGGCTWVEGGWKENGDSWVPNVASHGLMRCVRCQCKDGQTECARETCPRLSCRYQVHEEESSCCPRCAVNRQEIKMAKRAMKMQKIRRLRRLRRLRHQREQQFQQHQQQQQQHEQGA